MKAASVASRNPGASTGGSASASTAQGEKKEDSLATKPSLFEASVNLATASFGDSSRAAARNLRAFTVTVSAANFGNTQPVKARLGQSEGDSPQPGVSEHQGSQGLVNASVSTKAASADAAAQGTSTGTSKTTSSAAPEGSGGKTENTARDHQAKEQEFAKREQAVQLAVEKLSELTGVLLAHIRAEQARKSGEPKVQQPVGGTGTGESVTTAPEQEGALEKKEKELLAREQAVKQMGERLTELAQVYLAQIKPGSAGGAAERNGGNSEERSRSSERAADRDAERQLPAWAQKMEDVLLDLANMLKKFAGRESMSTNSRSARKAGSEQEQDQARRQESPRARRR